MRNLLNRLKNPGTILTIASSVVLILTTAGVEVDHEGVMAMVQAGCTIGIALGVLNNPTTPGLDNPFKKH